MQLASLPIAVVMQRRQLNHPWADSAWSACAVLATPSLPPSALPSTLRPPGGDGRRELYFVSGLNLELHRDENEGYFENWVAPSPKVFVMWQMLAERAMPVVASVSYSEGARMLDSGEQADGVPMPPEIHAWLGEYLRHHYQPRQRRGREHG